MVSSKADEVLKGSDHPLDLTRQPFGRLVAVIDARQRLRDHERVMGAKAALQRLAQRWQLGPQSPLGKLGERLGVADPGHQRLQHRPARDPQDVGGHAGQLDPGVLQHLLQPLHLTGALVDDRLAVAGEVA